jgi:hypothetical protein
VGEIFPDREIKNFEFFGPSKEKDPVSGRAQRRKGNCPEKEVGKCRIQTWREECEIFVPEWRTWR